MEKVGFTEAPKNEGGGIHRSPEAADREVACLGQHLSVQSCASGGERTIYSLSLSFIILNQG